MTVYRTIAGKEYRDEQNCIRVTNQDVKYACVTRCL